MKESEDEEIMSHLEFLRKEAVRNSIPVDKWFETITGVPECNFRPEEAISDPRGKCFLQIKNSVDGKIYLAGKFSLTKFGELEKKVKTIIPKTGTGLKKKKILDKAKSTQNLVKYPANELDSLASESVLINELSKSSLGIWKNPPKSPSSKVIEYITLNILTRPEGGGGDTRFVDVGHIQSLEANKNAVFQVASNFNGIEASSELSNPDSPSFTEKYYKDRTQGPAASISAGGGAICRVYASFYKSGTDPATWRQTSERQVNFLKLLAEHYPIRNGYVIFDDDAPKFPKMGSKEYRKLLKMAYIAYHKDVQVTSGYRNPNNETIELVEDDTQLVDQVLCSAVNVFQGRTGKQNSQTRDLYAKCRLVLDLAYQGCYLQAIANGRTQIYLTLIGGGMFRNQKD